MRIRDTNESVWTAGETSEELGDILKCGDRAALKLLVSERLNWRDCLDLLPAMVELALEDEPRKRGTPGQKSAAAGFRCDSMPGKIMDRQKDLYRNLESVCWPRWAGR